MKILAIVGSPRETGNTNFLVDKALAEAGQLGIETEKIVLSNYNIKPCLGHKDCASYKFCLQKDDASWILDKFAQADGVILATPVYWYNVTSQMKTFIDRNYFPYKHDVKYKAVTVGLIVVAEVEGIEETLHTLNQFVDWWFPIDKANKFTVQGYALAPGDIKRKKQVVTAAQALGRHMAEKLLAKK